MDPTTWHTRRKATCRVLTALFSFGAASLLWVAPAAAHTELSSSEPSAEDTVTEPVDTVVLVFTQAVSPELAEVRVTDPDGNRLDDGAPVMQDERVEQALLGPEQLGEHTVEWRVIALDGHPVEGTFTFAYDGELPDGEPDDPEVTGEAEPQPEPGEPDAAASPTDPADGSGRESHASSEEHAAEPDAPEEHGDEDATVDDDRDEQAAPPADDGARTTSAGWPLGIAALVIALTAGAAVYAVRAVRSWPVGADATAG